VLGLPGDEAQSRQVFEFARKMGLPAVTSEPKAEALDLLEKAELARGRDSRAKKRVKVLVKQASFIWKRGVYWKLSSLT
jgi:hypothetical protein